MLTHHLVRERVRVRKRFAGVYRRRSTFRHRNNHMPRRSNNARTIPAAPFTIQPISFNSNWTTVQKMRPYQRVRPSILPLLRPNSNLVEDSLASNWLYGCRRPSHRHQKPLLSIKLAEKTFLSLRERQSQLNGL